MPVATFDTLKFANTLKAAGVPSAQAEAQAVAFAEVIQLNLKDLATKDDVKAAEKELRKEIADAVKDVRQEVKDVEQRLTARLDVMSAEDKAFDAGVRGEIAGIRGEMLLLKWMLGVVVGGIVTILIRLFLFRGPI